MRRRNFLLGLVATAVAASTAAYAPSVDAGDVDKALDKITKARKKLKTLQAEFKQTRVIGLLASEVKSKGKLSLVTPNRLRWDLFPPDDVTYWIGPEGLTMRNKDGVTKIPKSSAKKFAAVLGDMMIMLGGDMKKLKKRYAITVTEKDGKMYLTAKPKAKEVKKHIARLELETDKDASVIRRIEIHEKGGDKSVIVFGKYKKNKKIDDDYMKPPKD